MRVFNMHAASWRTSRSNSRPKGIHPLRVWANSGSNVRRVGLAIILLNLAMVDAKDPAHSVPEAVQAGSGPLVPT